MLFSVQRVEQAGHLCIMVAVWVWDSIHAGVVIVADGTPEMKNRLNRVLTNDPGLGVARHADAGYEKAVRISRERKLKLPMIQ